MRWWRAGAIAAAATLAIVPLPAAVVERWYTDGIYPRVQSLVTAGSNRVPFALFDALIGAAVIWFVWRLLADVAARKTYGWIAVAGRSALRLVTAAAVFYLAFLACWGMNYRRVALPDKLAFERGRVSVRRAHDLALTAVARVNALYGDAHARDAEPLDTGALARSFGEAERELAVRHPARPARPKRTLFDRYFRLAAVDGMTDPYFLETFIVSDLFRFEQPFVVAHEWGHLAGFADESEANFVGWLACVHGAPDEQYSGWLFLYSEIVGRLSRADRVEVSARLGDGPRRDLRAVADRVAQQVSRPVSSAGWRVYDGYLKANRVEAGTASYSDVVKLVLGTEFDAEWKPRLRN